MPSKLISVNQPNRFDTSFTAARNSGEYGELTSKNASHIITQITGLRTQENQLRQAVTALSGPEEGRKTSSLGSELRKRAIGILAGGSTANMLAQVDALVMTMRRAYHAESNLASNKAPIQADILDAARFSDKLLPVLKTLGASIGFEIRDTGTTHRIELLETDKHGIVDINGNPLNHEKAPLVLFNQNIVDISTDEEIIESLKHLTGDEIEEGLKIGTEEDSARKGLNGSDVLKRILIDRITDPNPKHPTLSLGHIADEHVLSLAQFLVELGKAWPEGRRARASAQDHLLADIASPRHGEPGRLSIMTFSKDQIGAINEALRQNRANLVAGNDPEQFPCFRCQAPEATTRLAGSALASSSGS